MKALRVCVPVILSLTAILSAAELTVPPAPPGDTKPNVAVITLKNASGVQAGETEIISDRLRAELFNTGRVNVMERDQMQEILKEQGFQASGACTDEACLVEMGQLLGVSRLITGSMGKLGSMFMLNLRAIDVKTGRISKAVSKDISGGIEEVVDFLPDIARELTSGDAKSAPAPVVKEVKKEEPKVEKKAPEPAPEEVKPEVKEEAPQPVVQEDLREVDTKKERNRNRSGIHLGLNLYPGHMREELNFSRVYNDGYYSDFDTTVDLTEGYGDDPETTLKRQACINPELKFIIRAGQWVAITLGFSYQYDAITVDWYSRDPYATEPYTFTETMKHEARVFSFVVNPMFVAHVFPLKINVGPLVGLDLMAFKNTDEWSTVYDSYLLSDVSDDTTWARAGFGLSYGGNVGLEILAGPHVGFNLDMQIRYTSITTTEDDNSNYIIDSYSTYHYYTETDSRTVTLPLLGIGMGINFYY